MARPVVTVASKVLRAVDIRRARAGRQTPGSRRAAGMPVLLLTTTGSNSARQHTTPLAFCREPGGSLMVVASNGGADRQPVWLLNLRKSPLVGVELDGRRRGARAKVLNAEERARAWSSAVAAFPGLAEVQSTTGREIALVRLQDEDPSLVTTCDE